MTAGAPEVAEQLFLVEAPDTGDALLRVLGCFALQQARLVETRAVADGTRVSMRIIARGLTPARVEQLQRRISELPLAATVSVGWRSRPAASSRA
jgi:hypothetical protein